MNIAVVIPAYQPSEAMTALIQSLSEQDWRGIIIIDDGSHADNQKVFDALAGIRGVTILRHAVNLGKGAALKTGINHAACAFPDLLGVVTADADGQHAPEDILAIGKALSSNPNACIMGVRSFSSDVPWRSRFGNRLTQWALRIFLGYNLQDTQTGLRGIPAAAFAPLLGLASNRYEFELDMLILFRQMRFSIIQQPIQTIYIEDNRASHFNPVLDSIKIYFSLFRFFITSVITAVIDGAIFLICLFLGMPIYASQILARCGALVFNYTAVRNAVFFSKQEHAKTFPKYLLLVVVSGFVSYGLIQFLIQTFSLRAMAAKIIAESLVFLANYAIQRELIFVQQQNCAATNWDEYYSNPPVTAKYSRRISERLLIHLIKKYGPSPINSLVEIGGANSCFYDAIQTEIAPKQYVAIDNNARGMELLRLRAQNHPQTNLVLEDALNLHYTAQADVVFSVGLIEHFDNENVRRVIEAHFRLSRPGGIVIISFPTPTWLYRISRAISEATGMWRFYDERPLRAQDVLPTILEQGQVLYRKINWPIFFTQMVIVAQKKG
ncbi:MAG: glycosyltransferase [Candidatus Sumerlaeota bacterium]|nr:glycosyltransferase [Candidatus Sumerlaeota bacterium]